MNLDETPSPAPAGVRRRVGRQGESGQILLMYLIFLLPMTMILLTVFNVGMLTSEKMRLQNAADNAAYSAAVWEARYMNLTAYVNRTMIANYDALATVVAVWSMVDSLDGFLNLLINILRIFFDVGDALTPLHNLVAGANEIFAKAVGKSGNATSAQNPPAFGFYIEKYNQILSFVQEGLYVANQLTRQPVIKSIAWGVDANAQYNNVAEILNALSLNSRVKWDKTDTNGLRKSTERSINNFANGNSLRDGLADLLPEPFASIVNLHIDLFICEIGLTVGPSGFNGPQFDHVTGESPGCDEIDGRDDCDSKIVRDDRIYEHDFFGLSLDLCVASLDIGHHSDDDFNIGGSQNRGINLPHIADFEHMNTPTKHEPNFGDQGNGTGCSSLAGFSLGNSDFTAMTDALQVCSQIREQNEQIAQQNLGKPLNEQQPLLDEETVLNGEVQDCDDISDSFEDSIEGFEDSLGGAAGGGTPCAPMYVFSNDQKLTDVKVTTYLQDEAVIDGRRVEGPTVFVYFRKKHTHFPMFEGFGLTNPHDLEVYSFAKVYYAQRPGDTDDSPTDQESNKESLFNPFWAARLERPNLGFLLH